MKILFLYEEREGNPWIGDRCSIEVLTKGLNELGHEAIISHDVTLINTADRVVLNNICTDLTPYLPILFAQNKPYTCIPFHEDFLLYTSLYRSLHAYIANALITENPEEAISLLEHMPDILQYNTFQPKQCSLRNYPVMANAEVNIANSFEEEKMIHRYVPGAKTQTIFWTSGYADKEKNPYSDSFIKKFGQKKKGYILQIGRISPRKNQLSTILATKDMETPLVIIATGHFLQEQEYLDTCIETIKRFRKGPTTIISNAIKSQKDGLLEIINAPKGLTKEELVSAYQNAACYCHPAFYELPGYVYLEAAKLGTPTVASEWSTLKDYFRDHKSGEYTLDDRIEYIIPYHIPAIREAIEKQMTKNFKPSNHPIFKRSHLDVAREFLELNQGN